MSSTEEEEARDNQKTDLQPNLEEDTPPEAESDNSRTPECEDQVEEKESLDGVNPLNKEEEKT